MKTAKMCVREFAEAAVPGEVVYYRDLAVKYGYTDPAMSNAMAEIAREENSPLRPGPRAGYYAVAEPRPEADSMEVLGRLQDDALLLRDGRGRVWKAVPL